MRTTEESRKLGLPFLKKHNYLENGIRSGAVNWLRNEEKIASINIKTNCKDIKHSYIQLIYSYSSHNTEEESVDYKIRLDWDLINFGGKRWFFICPAITNNGGTCHNRVRDLCQNGKYFVCRKCANLVYNSQTIQANLRRYPWGVLDVDNYLEKKVKRMHYKGKPTKKYQTYLNKRERFGGSYREVNKEGFFL